MTLTKTIAVAGCTRTKEGVYVHVDLDEPETIGQHPNREAQICYTTPLIETIILEVENTGHIIPATNHFPRHAEVIVRCDHKNCVLHDNHVS